MAPTARTPVAAVGGVDFLSQTSTLYTGSFTLPAGRYALFFETLLQQPKEGARFTNPRLGVELTAYNLDKPGAEPAKQFLSMGSKAHESFAPSVDGKGLEPIVGGSGSVTSKSNWNLFRDSMYNAGLDNVAVNDLSVLDGLWVETAQEPEPEERAGFKTATGEVDAAPKAAGKIPVVIAILDGGKPWEGGGGIPDAPAPAKVTKMQPKPATTAAKPAPGRPAPAPAAAAGGDSDDAEAVKMAAVNAIGTVLSDERYVKGCPKLILKTGVFKAVEETEGKPMAQAVASAFFANDAQIKGILEEIGYTLNGNKVEAAQ